MSDGGHSNPRLGFTLGGVFVALAILVLSGILLAWFIWSVKYKKKMTVTSTTQNMYHKHGSESNKQTNKKLTK